MSAADADWLASYAIIQDTHDRVYHTVDTAIKCEEAETPQLAIVNYKLSVMLIDEALATPVGLPDDDNVELDATWHQAVVMIQKMQRSRGELLQRIATLVAKTEADEAAASAAKSGALQSDDVASTSSCGERPWTRSELSTAMTNTPAVAGIDGGKDSKLQLIYTCEQVKFYHILAGGDVSTTAENTVLRILCMAGNTEQHLQATFFLQIIAASISADGSPTSDEGEFNTIVDGLAIATEATPALTFDTPWIYPLVSGVSPCYFTKFGAFIFPDLYSTEHTNASVGIVVPDDSQQVLLEVLDAILLDVVREPAAGEGDDDEAGEAASDVVHRSRRSTSEQMSDSIVRGASYISRGLLFSSSKMSEFVERSTPYVMSKVTRVPANTDDGQPVVSPGMVSGMEVAKTATGVAASMTGYVADKVGAATMALGRYLAPHVQTKGTQLLSHTMGYSEEEAADKMSGVLIVAAGAVEGFGTVYAGLEQSAALLGNSLSNNTVRVIEHKYGASAGELAAGTFDTVGNVINISHNVSILTPKSLVKKTAKNASKAMIQGYRPATVRGRPTVPASELLYPEMSQFTALCVATAQK